MYLYAFKEKEKNPVFNKNLLFKKKRLYRFDDIVCILIGFYIFEDKTRSIVLASSKYKFSLVSFGVTSIS